MTNPDDPAFPPNKLDLKEGPILDQLMQQRGMTKREYFAAMAMQGAIMWDGFVNANAKEFSGDEAIAKGALKVADALIAELNKST